MFKISNIKILFFFILFINIKSEIEFETINLSEEGLSIDKLTGDYYYKINSNYTVLPNYIKITAQNDSLENLNETYYINHIISYYQQDSTFEERKQISQNITGITNMILTKEQIKDGFYFSIECSKNPCTYSLEIKSLDKVELSLGEQYTYYVTKENIEMNFIIKGNIESIYNLTEYQNGIISIWAKGNKEIFSELKESYTDRHSKFNGYIIKIGGINEIEYNIYIKGNIGDLINIGSLFFEGKINYTCPTIFNNSGIELTGFLKKNSINSICYKFSKNKSINKTISIIKYDHQSIVYLYENRTNPNYNLDCYSLPDMSLYEELFYSIHFMKDNKNDEQGNNKFPPQVLGIRHKRYIEIGRSIGIIPMKPDDNFNFLTYNIIANDKRINLYMHTCNTYPLCSTDPKKVINKKYIRNYGAASFTYTKEELSKNISPISKNQEIILIECENDKINNNDCIIELNIFTDKDECILIPYTLSLGYVKKDNEVSYLVDTKIENESIYLNVEVFSGDISINLNITNYNLLKNKNKNLYIIECSKINEFIIKIKGKENSAYSIGYYSKYMDFDNSAQYIVLNGGNYLFSLENKINSNMILYNFNEFENTLPNYLGIFPLDCKINVTNVLVNMNDFSPIYEDIINKQGFYQEIYTENDNKIENTFHFGYKISKIDNEKENCLFYASLCKIYNQSNTDLINGIILADKVPQLFEFSQKYNIMKFIYLHPQKDKNLKINTNLINEGIYKLILSFDDEIYEKEYNIIANKSITIKPEEWNDLCIKDEKQLCKLSFYIISEKFEKNSIIEVTVNSEIPINSDDSNNNNIDDSSSNTTLIVIIIVIIILLIIVIVLVIFVVKRKKMKNSIENIDNVKFENEMKNTGDKESNLLTS